MSGDRNCGSGLAKDPSAGGVEAVDPAGVIGDGQFGGWDGRDPVTERIQVIVIVSGGEDAVVTGIEAVAAEMVPDIGGAVVGRPEPATGPCPLAPGDSRVEPVGGAVIAETPAEPGVVPDVEAVCPRFGYYEVTGIGGIVIPGAIDESVAVDVGLEVARSISHADGVGTGGIDIDIFCIVDGAVGWDVIDLGRAFGAGDPWTIRTLGGEPDASVETIECVG